MRGRFPGGDRPGFVLGPARRGFTFADQPGLSATLLREPWRPGIRDPDLDRPEPGRAQLGPPALDPLGTRHGLHHPHLPALHVAPDGDSCKRTRDAGFNWNGVSGPANVGRDSAAHSASLPSSRLGNFPRPRPPACLPQTILGDPAGRPTSRRGHPERHRQRLEAECAYAAGRHRGGATQSQPQRLDAECAYAFLAKLAVDGAAQHPAQSSSASAPSTWSPPPAGRGRSWTSPIRAASPPWLTISTPSPGRIDPAKTAARRRIAHARHRHRCRPPQPVKKPGRLTFLNWTTLTFARWAYTATAHNVRSILESPMPHLSLNRTLTTF